jgi:ribosome-associated translation inhibitor RaiA
MTDKLQEKINHGQHAKRLLDDENFNAVLSQIGSDEMVQSYKAPTVDAREEARDVLRALDRIRAKLETMVANGREAERELQRAGG